MSPGERQPPGRTMAPQEWWIRQKVSGDTASRPLPRTPFGARRIQDKPGGEDRKQTHPPATQGCEGAGRARPQGTPQAWSPAPLRGGEGRRADRRPKQTTPLRPRPPTIPEVPPNFWGASAPRRPPGLVVEGRCRGTCQQDDCPAQPLGVGVGRPGCHVALRTPTSVLVAARIPCGDAGAGVPSGAHIGGRPRRFLSRRG